MKVPVGITHFIGNVALKLGKHGPTIAIGAGCLGVVTACVMACKNTPEAVAVVDDTAHELELAKEGLEDKKELSKQVFYIYKTSAIELCKLYGPAFLIGAASLGSIIFAHRVMVGRVATLSTMYAALDGKYKELAQQFLDYVRDKGDENYEHGLEEVTVEVEEEDPKTGAITKREVKGMKQTRKPIGYSQYAVCFDDSSRYWKNNAAVNYNFLKTLETIFTDKLDRVGFVMLNEVLDALGLPLIPDGQLVGWFKGKGDNYVSFRIEEYENSAFLGGWEPSVWLDFNVCGEVWFLIGKNLPKKR